MMNIRGEKACPYVGNIFDFAIVHGAGKGRKYPKKTWGKSDDAEYSFSLYKYKSFSVDSLDLLVSDRLYFADPTTFNDPLDCNPSVVNDIDNADELNAILHKLVKEFRKY
ncbi:hypothetical protein [Rahnella victoriana]|uniref:Uncharacterized protein n=1 Tax=Rahnella victoriana TaxID=1510570 RepID=A0ABS0DY08_9GAMM|nr:hypothetical protein [Rahnella victoriana]MBF7958781.1 hypothetical protein [Rahnella victoriana]